MTSRNTALIVFVVLTLGVMLGFTNSNDPSSSKTNTPYVVDETVYPPAISSSATVIYVDSLNGNNDTTALKSRGYKVWYRGAGPQGLTATWFQGGTSWNSFNGPPTGYVHANYNVVTGTNNIDSWLISPPLSIAAGDSLMFWERSVAANPFPDSMRIMYSAAGDSVPEGTGWVELGRFLNSEGGQWVQRKYRLATAGATGRFALRYNVVSGGPTGANSNLIGVDMITVTRDAVTPGTCTYTWTPNTSGTTQLLHSVSTVSELIGWAGGAASTVRRTTDGGQTWTNANPTTPSVIQGDIYNIYAWSANDAICTTSPAATFVYKTTNGGTTWTQVYTLAGGFINALQMISPTEGYGEGDPVGGSWTIIKTTDGGNTWARMATQPVQVGSEAGWNNSFQIVGTNMWFGTSTTKVYRSTDLGLTWTSAPATGVASTFALHYNNATTGLTGGSGTVMLKSTDGGASYTSAGNLPGASGSISGITGGTTDFWTVRTGTDVYRTTNQGGTWTTAHTMAGAAFSHIDFKDVSGCPTGWAVTQTGGIAQMKSQIVGVNNYSSEIPNSYLLKQNFPNPFNPTTNINFTIPQAGLVKLKVYDMIGKEVATLVNENKTAGNYIVGFNASNLPSGAYFYRIEANNFVDTKKMLLIK